MNSRSNKVGRALLCLLLAAAFAATAHAGDLSRIRVKNGHGFVTADGRPFVPFGVSYYRPGTGWAPQVWKKFDAEATRQDFARMKALGVNCVRVFLSFGSFYHQPGILDTNGLAKFDQFLDIAEAAGIRVHPTGPDLWEGPPDWPVGGIGDEKTLSALEQFWKLFAARYRDRTVIFAYDLRNEPAVGWDELGAQWNTWLQAKYGSTTRLAAAWATNGASFTWGSVPVPPKTDALRNGRLLDFQEFRETIADEWTRRQAAAIKAVAPESLVTVGMVQWSVPALLPVNVGYFSGFEPKRQARFLDFTEVHFYPLADGGYKYQDAQSEMRNLAYLESVVRAAKQKGKPLVLAEFGWYGGNTKPTFNGGQFPQASEDQQAQYDRAVIDATTGIASGWLNWGFYDQPEANDCSQLTGLATADGKTKAWGEAFQTLAAYLKEKPFLSRKVGPRPDMDWYACLTSMKAQEDYRSNYFEAFTKNP